MTDSGPEEETFLFIHGNWKEFAMLTFAKRVKTNRSFGTVRFCDVITFTFIIFQYDNFVNILRVWHRCCQPWQASHSSIMSRKPTWWPGRLFAHLMNLSHRQLDNSGGLATFRWRRTVSFWTWDVVAEERSGQSWTLLSHQRARFMASTTQRPVSPGPKRAELPKCSLDQRRKSGHSAGIRSPAYLSPPGAFDVVTAVETHYYLAQSRGRPPRGFTEC